MHNTDIENILRNDTLLEAAVKRKVARTHAMSPDIDERIMTRTMHRRRAKSPVWWAIAAAACVAVVMTGLLSHLHKTDQAPDSTSPQLASAVATQSEKATSEIHAYPISVTQTQLQVSQTPPTVTSLATPATGTEPVVGTESMEHVPAIENQTADEPTNTREDYPRIGNLQSNSKTQPTMLDFIMQKVSVCNIEYKELECTMTDGSTAAVSIYVLTNDTNCEVMRWLNQVAQMISQRNADSQFLACNNTFILNQADGANTEQWMAEYTNGSVIIYHNRSDNNDAFTSPCFKEVTEEIRHTKYI